MHAAGEERSRQGGQSEWRLEVSHSTTCIGTESLVRLRSEVQSGGSTVR